VISPSQGERVLTKAPARPVRVGVFCWALVLVALLLAGGLGRLARVETQQGQTLVWLWAWQQGRVEFINSITGRPVAIDFGVPWRFADFAARTDPGTEEYYTAGTYVWNQRLASETSRQISYCSEVGMTLVLGEQVFQQQGGGCLVASLIWPP
jgi:hypothetical protein